jgi:transposase
LYTLILELDMASFHSKVSHGHRYWYIVESRRINGKPRPVVLAYLGKAEDLLRRLEDRTGRMRIKSYSHGAVAALLEIASVLEIPELINRYVQSPRRYTSSKPLRHQLTVGMTLLLGAIGRVCMPTSKRGWWTWAQTTSCEYLLRCNLSRIDSQHFWDLMDALPVDSIERIERTLLQHVQERYALSTDTLFYDTTNFFTYIATTNRRCTLAQRGKNKQKRQDLRQVGLALVVTREDQIPLFHLTYEGNRHDALVFQRVGQTIKQRLTELGLELEKHTLVFDRGNNSQKNLAAVQALGFHYVGALTPYHHPTLIRNAQARFAPVVVQGETMKVYRDQREIWGESRTVIVYVSERLKEGQQRGIHQLLEKTTRRLHRFQNALQRAQAPAYDRAQLEARITHLLPGPYLKKVIDWSLTEESAGKFRFTFSLNADAWAAVQARLGFRILMTSRHDWSTAEIIQAYHGQSHIEAAFKNLKNPYHLALKPQFHWTDQKIRVHYFMCVLGYLLAALVWKQTRRKAKFSGSLDTLLDTLNNIRLATLIEKSAKPGHPKVTYQLEELSPTENTLMEALGLHSTHLKRPQFQGVSVYTSDST